MRRAARDCGARGHVRLGAWLCFLLVICVGCSKAVSTELPTVPTPQDEPELAQTLRTLHAEAIASPTDGAARGVLAMAYDVNGFHQRAIAVYGQAAALAPGEFRWPYFRALLVAQHVSDFEDALASVGDAIAIDDGYVPAWLYRAEWLRELGRREVARDAYQRAVDLGAGAPATVGLARLYLDQGGFEEAVAILEPVNAATPDPRIEAQLARAYRGLGRDEDARIAAARAAGTAGSMHWIDPLLATRVPYIAGFSNRLLHAQNLVQAGRAEDALAIAEALVEERPDDAMATNTLVWANAVLERFGTVKSLLWDSLDRFPDDPRLHRMLADAYGREGDHASARRHLEQAVAADPGNARALEDLGWLTARLGEREQGIAFLERALANGAHEPKQVLYRLGLLDGAAERWERAAERFGDATRIDPAFTMAYVHLGRCLAESGDFERAREALDWADRLGTHARERTSARRRLAELEHPAP